MQSQLTISAWVAEQNNSTVIFSISGQISTTYNILLQNSIDSDLRFLNKKENKNVSSCVFLSIITVVFLTKGCIGVAIICKPASVAKKYFKVNFCIGSEGSGSTH